VPSVQWDKLFIFTVSPFELIIRGSIVYLVIFVMMRVLRREPGTVGIADLLMVVEIHRGFICELRLRPRNGAGKGQPLP